MENIIKRKLLHKIDIIAILSFVILMMACYLLREELPDCFNTSTQITQAYSVKKGADGSYYVLDDGHNRLIKANAQGVLEFELSDVALDDTQTLYIDDYVIDEKGNLYIQASEWYGMNIAKELIIQYDTKGRYVDTLLRNDYNDMYINKHKIYGISVENSKMSYIIAQQDEIHVIIRDLINETNDKSVIKYDDAFNAILDCVFVSDEVYLLNKNGMLERYIGDDKTVLYDTTINKEENTRIPYRFAVSENGEVYFSDIKNKTIQKVDMHTRLSQTFIKDVNTLTVNIDDDTHRILIAENDAVIETDAVENIIYDKFDDNVGTLAKKWLVVIFSIAVVVLLGYMITRFRYLEKNIKISTFAQNCIYLVSIVLMVIFIVVAMLMKEFEVNYRSKICEQIEIAAYIVANQLSAKDIENITDAKSFDGESYKRICRIMEQSYSTDLDFYRQIYCNILAFDGDEAYAVAYLDQTIGTYFPLDDYETQEVIQVYETGRSVWNDGKDDISGTYLYVKVPVFTEEGKVGGVVSVGTLTTVIDEMVSDMVKKILTTIIVILLLICLAMSEGMILISAKEKYNERVKTNCGVFPGYLLRILVFSIFVAYNMSSTFLPVFLIRRSVDVGGMSKELLASLPITINIFTIGLMSLVTNKMVHKLGIKKLCIISGCFSFVGNILIFLIPVYPIIFVGLLLDGIGVGLLSNAAYILITYIKDEESRTECYSIYNGACLAGINFGMMVGSILAVNMNHQNVFACIAIVWIIVILLLTQIAKKTQNIIHMNGVKSAEKEKEGKIAHFILDRKVLSFMVLIQNPYIIFNSFIFYYMPLFCDFIGQSEVAVSILLMLYSEIAVLLGDIMTKKTFQKFKYNSMYLACFMNIVALVLFAWTYNMTGMVIALIIMGISAGFGKPVQQIYYTEMDGVKKYGEDKAMGIYNFTENIGESLGPVVFGRLMTFTPINVVFTVFGGTIACLGALHLGINKLTGYKKGESV